MLERLWLSRSTPAVLVLAPLLFGVLLDAFFTNARPQSGYTYNSPAHLGPRMRWARTTSTLTGMTPSQ